MSRTVETGGRDFTEDPVIYSTARAGNRPTYAILSPGQ
jgi:hypothetical protein